MSFVELWTTTRYSWISGREFLILWLWSRISMRIASGALHHDVSIVRRGVNLTHLYLYWWIYRVVILRTPYPWSLATLFGSYIYLSIYSFIQMNDWMVKWLVFFLSSVVLSFQFIFIQLFSIYFFLWTTITWSSVGWLLVAWDEKMWVVWLALYRLREPGPLTAVVGNTSQSQWQVQWQQQLQHKPCPTQPL